MKPLFIVSLSVAVCLTDVNSSAQTQETAKIRVVNCEEKVQSAKRGICANQLFQEDFKALAPGVSWFHNWHFTAEYLPPKDVNFDFVPTVWGHDEGPAGLTTYLETHAPPRAILAINEPNMSGQAGMTPEQAAVYYKKIKAIADRYKVPVVGPDLSIGSSEGESMQAVDPFTNKMYTYTFMVPFLRAFNYFMGEEEVPYVSFHSFGNFGEMRWAVKLLQDTMNKPIWVTEYAFSAKDMTEASQYLVQTTDFLESNPGVKGYSWFKERRMRKPLMSLLEAEPGKLSPLGKLYVAMPVHDADLYYRIPGRLQAECYVSKNAAEIEITTDGKEGKEGFDMTSLGPASLEYNIQVDKAGTYKLKFRVSGPAGEIQVMQGDQTLGKVSSSKSEWDTVEAEIKLPAGPQKLSLNINGQSINWIEFLKSK